MFEDNLTTLFDDFVWEFGLVILLGSNSATIFGDFDLVYLY